MSEETPWWREAVIYQVYPRSFNDTDDDGIGDIPGIVQKLDYFEELGVDALWLSPVYASPNVDNGYDVSDYRSIMDEFGTMEDWERLLDGLHERDMRLIMDMVLNHTSTEHEWFLEARESADSEYRDYYFWREDDGDDPPNDWESVWGGPAWTRDEESDEYYLHLFHERQADLDWTDPQVTDEIFDVVDWWLEKGVDGFRLDSVNLISKPDGLPETGPNEDPNGLGVVANGPRVGEHLRALCERVHAHDGVVTIGETPNLSVEEAKSYIGPGSDSLSMLLSFEHMEIDRGEGARWAMREWSLPELKDSIACWQTGLDRDEWQGLYFNNHDQPRAVSRFGDDEEYRRESAKALATLLFTLRGTPFIYQGEEIGMTNPRFERLDEIQDVATRRTLAHAVENGQVSGFDEVEDLINRRTRDNARTPMQWSADENAGFTEGEPWLKVNEDYPEVNVAAARDDADSVWHYYRRLIELRSEHPVFVHGDFELLLPDHPGLFAYLRTHEAERVLVVLELGGEASRFELPAFVEYDDFELLVANYEQSEEPGITDVPLRPYEARVYRLD